MSKGQVAITMFDDQVQQLVPIGIASTIRALVDAHLYPGGVPIQVRILRAQATRKAGKRPLVSDMLDAGYSVEQTAALLGISEVTVERYMRRRS